MKNITKRLGGLILALVMVVSVIMVPSNSQTAAAADVSVPAKVSIGVGYVYNNAITITIPTDYSIKRLRTNKSDLYVYKTYQSDDSGDYKTIKLGLYSKKAYTNGAAAVKFSIADEDDEYTSYSVKVYASNDTPFKKVTFKGKSLLSDSKLPTLGNDSFVVSSDYIESLYTTGKSKVKVGDLINTSSFITTYTSGVFKVKMNSGYTLQNIQVLKYGDTTTNASGVKARALTVEKTVTAKKVKTTLSENTYYYKGTGSNGEQYKYMQAPTIFRVTYTDKYAGTTLTQDFILNKIVNRINNDEDDE
ncbi:MAG: hypothetical protein K6B41_14820 [Butyrivibrio sp.]|nr:hypothetical protein [Butyrivibrio sp.]